MADAFYLLYGDLQLTLQDILSMTYPERVWWIQAKKRQGEYEREQIENNKRNAAK